MKVSPALVDKAALALFTQQARDWDLPAAAAEMEWEASVDLRDFWRGQVAVVLGTLGEAGVIDGYVLTQEGRSCAG